MKKLISTLLSCALLISTVPIFAESNTEEMEKILLHVKERIGDTEKYDEFNSDSYTTKNSTVYNFRWNTSKDEHYSSLDVSCNSEGVITSFSIYDSEKNTDNSKLSISGTKRADALKKAQEEIKKLNPEIAENLQVFDTALYESFRTGSYRFRIQRYENGIPVLNDTGSINLNSDCTLKSFYISYTTGLSFNSAENAISKDAAVSAYNQNIGVDLYYITSYNDSDKPEIKLVYSPKGGNSYINAVTGEMIEITPDYDTFEATESAANMKLDSAGGSGAQKQLSRAELQKIEEIDGLISKDNADKIARECEYFNLNADAVLSSSSLYYNDFTKTYTYQFTYASEKESNATVKLNAATGEIIYFNKWKDIPYDAKPDSAKISKLSEEIINNLAKDKAAEFKIKPDSNEASYYSYYTRYINDIPFNENTISLRFDSEYNLTMYSISYYDMTFPLPENIISANDAFSNLSNIGEYKIFYIADYESKKFIPVYNLTKSYTIDAFTGKSIYPENENTSGGEYSDISGHYAEDKIKTLAEYGIFLDGTELNPDDPITQKDYIALLSIVFYYNDVSVLRSSYSADILYKSLPTGFLLTPSSPQAHLTRLDAAKLMVKAMGAEEYAELSHIYTPLYNDVSEDIGYINILTGLKVLSGDGTGNFNPNNEITRAQALIMIYNYLSR